MKYINKLKTSGEDLIRLETKPRHSVNLINQSILSYDSGDRTGLTPTKIYFSSNPSVAVESWDPILSWATLWNAKYGTSYTYKDVMLNASGLDGTISDLEIGTCVKYLGWMPDIWNLAPEGDEPIYESLSDKDFIPSSVTGILGNGWFSFLGFEDYYDAITDGLSTNQQVSVGNKIAIFFNNSSTSFPSTTLTFEDGTTCIGDADMSYTFENVTEVSLPNTIKIIQRSICLPNLEEINIPEGCIILDNSALNECPLLEDISLPSTLLSIGDYAFLGTALSGEFVLPQNLKFIGIAPFPGGVDEIEIPASVEEISGAVLTCASGTMSVASGNSKYDSRENSNTIIETAKNRLIAAIPGSTIPRTVTSIGPWFMYTYGVDGNSPIIIPEHIKEISDRAFEHIDKPIKFMSPIPPDIDYLYPDLHYDAQANITISVPQDSVSAYEASPWGRINGTGGLQFRFTGYSTQN